MGTVYCVYDWSLDPRDSDFSRLSTVVFNFSVKWRSFLVFVDRFGMPMNLQDTTTSELSRSLEMPLCILQWQSLCERHLERVLDDLGVRHSFRADIIRAIMRTTLWGSRDGRQQVDMSIKLELVMAEEVETEVTDEGFIMEDMDEGFTMEDTDDGFIGGGYESDPDQALRGVSRSTIEKLERESFFVLDDDDACCCICLEKLDGASKVIEIPCSHLFHSRCIVEWLERNDSCPLCRSKVEVEDPE